jgi:hypothetical protein
MITDSLWNTFPIAWSVYFRNENEELFYAVTYIENKETKTVNFEVREDLFFNPDYSIVW